MSASISTDATSTASALTRRKSTTVLASLSLQPLPFREDSIGQGKIEEIAITQALLRNRW